MYLRYYLSFSWPLLLSFVQHSICHSNTTLLTSSPQGHTTFHIFCNHSCHSSRQNQNHTQNTKPKPKHSFKFKMRSSNHLVGVVNFITFLLSIPILGGGIWLSNKASSSDCLHFLQWPLIIIGASIMVVSLAGFAGSCYRNTLLLWVYLFCMFFIIAALIGFVVFAYVVTNKGSGRDVLNRVYKDYYLEDYGGWLQKRVSDEGYWGKIRSCVRDSRVCGKMRRSYGGYYETADQFYVRKLNPVQSGCCKPPTECGFTYNNETIWTLGGGLMGNSADCLKWKSEQSELCYNCDSCKAGVIASIKRSWRKVSVINIVMLILLVIVYIIGCAAFRNNRRMDNDESYGETRMTKSHPSRFHF